jgi:long-subunit fatty acid transport protein
VRTQWTARIDNDTMPDLAHAIEQEGGTVDYTDDDLEDPNYAAQLQFSDLTATKFSFSAGLHVKITPQVSVGVAYVHGAYVQNTGDASITFSCPPQSDRLARLGAERLGICYADTTADATIGYTLPDRVHGGIAWEPTDHARIEAMGGWVGWSVYDNFEVGVHNVDLAEDDAKDLVEQDRLWALDNKDTFWAGVDGKGRLGDKWTLGGRLLYDHSAVPDSTLSVNNYDANDWMVSGLVAFRPVSRFEVGLSWTHHFLETRDVAESAYGQTVVYEERKEDRYFYPHTDGKYGGVVDRAGIAVRAYF